MGVGVGSSWTLRERRKGREAWETGRRGKGQGGMELGCSHFLVVIDPVAENVDL